MTRIPNIFNAAQCHVCGVVDCRDHICTSCDHWHTNEACRYGLCRHCCGESCGCSKEDEECDP